MTLTAEPERRVRIRLKATGQDGATKADYGAVPAGVVFDSGETEESFTFTATRYAVDDGESFTFAFSTLPA